MAKKKLKAMVDNDVLEQKGQGKALRKISPKKIILVHPGHGISTLDVYTGAGDALAAAGHDVKPYDLRNRLQFYTDAVKMKIEGTNRKISIDQVYEIACQGLLVNILKYMPDMVLYITGQYIPPGIPALIKERFPTVKQVVWYTESPYMLAHEIVRTPMFDYVFTCDKVCEPIYKKFHPENRVYYLPTAYNSKLEWNVELRRWENVLYSSELFFVGSEVPGRLSFLQELAPLLEGKINFKIFGAFPSVDRGFVPELKKFYSPKTLNKFQVAKYIKKACITLNHFRVNESKRIVRNRKTNKSTIEEVIPYSLSPRVYEILATGGFCLTQYRKEFDDLDLKDGRDVVFYTDARDCAEKVLYYIEHSKERRKIQIMGQDKILEHTYFNRIDILLNKVFDE